MQLYLFINILGFFSVVYYTTKKKQIQPKNAKNNIVNYVTL